MRCSTPAGVAQGYIQHWLEATEASPISNNNNNNRTSTSTSRPGNLGKEEIEYRMPSVPRDSEPQREWRSGGVDACSIAWRWLQSLG